MKRPALLLGLVLLAATAHGQQTAAPQPATPPVDGPRRFQAAYPMQYDPMPVEDIAAVLARVHAYLDSTTPPRLVDRDTDAEIADYSVPNTNAVLARGDFRLVSYEWGVTYSGMLHAAEATGDARYSDYVASRVKFIADVAPMFPPPPPGTPFQPGAGRNSAFLFRSVNAPRSLDDSGAMSAAFIKAARAGIHADALRPYIDRYLDFIATGQMRLADGTLARNRPLHNALWLDDLYMSVPALAQMGALTGESRYFDDAVKQILQFSERMFVPERGLYMHGWIEGMDPHP
ncbi:MAG TPA: glycoside hydrolase family 88 protein, partial [Opitutaceae bacterium]